MISLGFGWDRDIKGITIMTLARYMAKTVRIKGGAGNAVAVAADAGNAATTMCVAVVAVFRLVNLGLINTPPHTQG